ncbi:hypothetical protein [Kitasatospora sp. NPDC058478]|uniref:hypothetical protein n=1 Tax=unclassified Kitasatospora TaxID=2633591 RepID=UPI0036497E79
MTDTSPAANSLNATVRRLLAQAADIPSQHDETNPAAELTIREANTYALLAIADAINNVAAAIRDDH